MSAASPEHRLVHDRVHVSNGPIQPDDPVVDAPPFSLPDADLHEVSYYLTVFGVDPGQHPFGGRLDLAGLIAVDAGGPGRNLEPFAWRALKDCRVVAVRHQGAAPPARGGSMCGRFTLAVPAKTRIAPTNGTIDRRRNGDSTRQPVSRKGIQPATVPGATTRKRSDPRSGQSRLLGPSSVTLPPPAPVEHRG